MKRVAIGVLAVLTFGWALGSVAGRAASAGAPVGDAATFSVAGNLRTLAWPVPPEVLDALRLGDWAKAGTALRALPQTGWTDSQRSSWAFLVGWAAVQGGAPASAQDVLPLLTGPGATGVPEVYAAYVRGEILLAGGKHEDALTAFDAVSAGYRPVIAPLGALRAADALVALNRTDEARARLESAAQFADRSQPAERLLVRLGEMTGGDAGYALLRRVWTEVPGTDADKAAIAALTPLNRAPTWQERALRAERWMDASDWGAAMAETEGILAEAAGTSLDACRLRFVRGRSAYKRNRIAEAATVLATIGPDCAKVDVDYGPRGLYLLATAQYRRKLFAESAAAYRQIVTHYPQHSMADDALTRGGIALLEGGRPADAEAWWEEALRDYPDGDTVPEAQLRLALHRYLGGDGAAARELAAQLGRRPSASDPGSVAAGRYWAARWRVFADATTPDTATIDASARSEAVQGWRALCEELPHSFYSVLSYARLAELAPDVAAQVSARPAGHDPGTALTGWDVRWELAREPHLRDGVALARLGLINEARAEWAASPHTELAPDERAWLSELRIAAGDWLAAHDELARWLGKHPFGTLGPHEAAIIRVAYPDRYWAEVQAAVAPTYRYEPRLFHGLVREESHFDAKVVSFAGAVGLSQLMPATARQTAGWLGISVVDKDLVQPATNLKIGARYLDALVGQLGGSPYLALAAYNGGATNVTKWVTEDQNPPTDEYVEQIPFEETRGYVKRVMGTWQTMRYRYDVDRPAFPDLSRFNHHALVGAQ